MTKRIPVGLHLEQSESTLDPKWSDGPRFAISQASDDVRWIELRPSLLQLGRIHRIEVNMLVNDCDDIKGKDSVYRCPVPVQGFRLEGLDDSWSFQCLCYQQ